jgi:hypothetical protein
MTDSIPQEIAALRRRLAEIERMAAEQRPDAAGPEVDVNAEIRRVSAKGRGTGSASRTTPKEKQT